MYSQYIRNLSDGISNSIKVPPVASLSEKLYHISQYRLIPGTDSSVILKKKHHIIASFLIELK